MATDPLPATGGFHDIHEHESEGWWQKLKHFFYGEKAKEGRSKGVASDTSMNFGSGEGHLATYPEYDHAYSGSAFESAFSGMGVTQSKAQSLVGSLQHGGAIVSVDAAGRLEDAERILERNNGRIRFEAIAGASKWSDIPGERVRIFGRLSHAYPDYLSETDVSRRKAS